jgi:hypothetical protein
MLGSRVWRWWLGTMAMGAVASLDACVIEGGPGPTATELYRLIDAHCASATTCGCAWAVTDEDACATELEARWKTRLAAALDRGLRYDAECFAAITTQIEDWRCYWPGGDTPLCESYCAPLHGDRAEGDSCQGDGDADGLVSDCAQGLYCLDGTCTAPCAALGGRREGEPCGNEILGPYDDCAGGLHCSWVTGQCEPEPTVGDPCLEGNCGADLYCSWQTNTCVTAAGAGQPCIDVPCIDGLVCDWQSNTCFAGAGEGQSCNERQCAEGLSCEWSEGDGNAYCRTYATEGQDCSQRQCADLLWCGDSNVCVTAPTEGEPCLFGSLCDDELVCDFVQNLCVAPPPEGQPCASGTCAEGSWCDTAVVPEGICAPRLALDEMCAGHRQCESGYCPNGFCWPLPLEGDACTGAGVCAGGLVCNGTTCEPTLTRAPAACSYAGW